MSRSFVDSNLYGNDLKSKVNASSKEADVLRACRVIIWDEASMIDKRLLLIASDLLCDLCRDQHNTKSTVPFAGKVVLIGGDFRQVLPVIPNSCNPAHIIHATIKRSPLYAHFEHLSITQNMRASGADQEFITWLMNVGNGSENERYHQQRTDDIVIPSRYLLTIPDEMMIVTKISNIPTSFVISFDMSLVTPSFQATHCR
jgi:hypothetical protein